jgi:putative phosphoesterase
VAGGKGVRLLVVSDLHANWPALEAVLEAEAFDRAIVVGDLVSYGPHPVEVVDWVRHHASAVVRGNHDDALARGSDCRCAPSSKPLAAATRTVHRVLLSAEQIGFLDALPRTVVLRDSARVVFAVHASPRNHLYRYTLTPDAPERHLQKQLGAVRADYLLLGHTHLPMLRRLGPRLVLNPGSAGQPRDGDPRASYAVIEDGIATLKRVRYDVDRTARDIQRMPVPADVADRLAAILRAGKG